MKWKIVGPSTYIVRELTDFPKEREITTSAAIYISTYRYTARKLTDSPRRIYGRYSTSRTFNPQSGFFNFLPFHTHTHKNRRRVERERERKLKFHLGVSLPEPVMYCTYLNIYDRPGRLDDGMIGWLNDLMIDLAR